MTRIPDLDAKAAWALLEREPDAALVDVRSRPEWGFVGLPDLSALGRKPHLVSWQDWTPQGMVPSPRFATEFAALGLPRDSAVIFVCRSGARSRSAAQAMAALGWTRCFNLAGGFEGDRDANRHRGTVGGWKVAGLPWVQE